MSRHHESLVIGVDANLPYRGTTHTQDLVCRLLARYGLASNVLLVCGYSGEKAPSNNGWIIDGYDPAERVLDDAAPSEVLANLARVSPGSLDWAMLDGNHDADYLRGDLAALAPLIRSRGLAFPDDCTASWPGVADVFEEHRSTEGPWRAVATDGRIGVLERVDAVS